MIRMKFYYNRNVDHTSIQWSLRITDTLGTWLLSVVENCPLLGDWSIFLSKHPICIILNAVLHVLLRLSSNRRKSQVLLYCDKNNNDFIKLRVTNVNEAY